MIAQFREDLRSIREKATCENMVGGSVHTVSGIMASGSRDLAVIGGRTPTNECMPMQSHGLVPGRRRSEA